MKLGTLLSMAAMAVMGMGLALPAQAADPIKIGVYLPLTGQNAFGGQLELEGIQLAHKLNRPSSTARRTGRRRQQVRQGRSRQRRETPCGTRQVVALIGTYGSSLAMAGAEVAEKAAVPGVGTSCTNPLVTQGKKYYFRACFIDPYQGAAAATYAYETLGFRKAAVLMDMTSDYAVGLSNFSKRPLRRSARTRCRHEVQLRRPGLHAQLTELISKKPDIVFMPAYFAEGAIIMKQARELGATFVLMGADAMDNPDTLKIGGKAVKASSTPLPL